MFDRFRQRFTPTTTEPAPAAPAGQAAPRAAADVPAARPADGGRPASAPPAPRRERTLPAQLAPLGGKAPTRSGLAHARDKMRHRRWEFAVPFFQAGRTEQAISPQDVAHPRYARVDHPDIAPEQPPAQHDRIARYAKRAQDRSADAAKTGDDESPPRDATPGGIARQLAAATGEGALRRFIDDAFSAPVLPASDAGPDLLAAVSTALGWTHAEGDDADTRPGVHGEAAHPRAVLARRLADLGGPVAAGETMHGALIAAALTQAGIDHPQVALDVLARCASLPLETLTSPRALAALDEHGQRAIYLMTILTRGNRCNCDAFAALRASAGQPIARERRIDAVQALLGAADHQRTNAERTDAAPTATNGAGDTTRMARPRVAPAQAITRTLGEALRVGGDRPATSLPARTIAAAARLLTEGPDALHDAERYDLFCWRQGDRDAAPGSDLARKNHRLQKFVTQAVSRLAQSPWDRARSLPRRVLGHDKSPLSAATLGLGGLPRDTLQKEQAQLASGMRDALTELVRGRDEEAPLLDAARALRHADPVGSLVEVAALHVWLEGGLNKDRVTAEDLPAIAAKAHDLARAAARDAPVDAVETCAALAALAARDAAALRDTRPFDAIVKRHYTADSLERWGRITGVPDTATLFWAQVERLRQLAKPAEKRLDERSVAAGRDLLVEVIGSLKPGSRLRLSDGHRYGVSTRGLSVSMSNLLHLSAVPLSAQLNARVSRGREAVVEISRSAHGVEIFIGTTKRIAGQIDAGAFAGYRFGMGLAEARAGAAVNAMFVAGERDTSDGVVIGIGRRPNDAGTGYQDAAMLEKAATILSALFADGDAATGAHARPGSSAPSVPAAATKPACAAQRVFASRFDDADLSLSWTSTRDKVYSTGASVTAGVTVRLPGPGPETDGGAHGLLPLGLGPTAGVAYIHDLQRQRDTVPPAVGEQPPAMAARRVEQHGNGGGSRWIGRLGVGTSANTTVNVSDAGRAIGVGVLTLDTPAMHTAFRNTRMTARLQLVRDAQRLNHRACMLDREFASPSAYIQAVESERGAWVALFAAQERAGGQSEAAAEKAAHVVIDVHLANARANWRPNQTLFTRHRLRAYAARTLDLHAALRDQLPPTAPGTPDTLRALARADARILEDAASYMPIELKGKESVDHERLVGPNIFLHLGARKAVASTREFVTQNVAFGTMERLDATLPRGQATRGI